MLVVMPIVALALARAFELRPSVEIVLVAFALSPIPPLLPRRQGKAGGDRSYAVALMALVGVLSIASIPLGARVVGRYFGQPFAMSPRVIAAAVLEAAVLPLVAGLLFRAMLPAAAARVTKPIGVIANVLLAVGVVALLAPTLPAVFALIGNWTILGLAAFVIAGLATGHVLLGRRPMTGSCSHSRPPAGTRRLEWRLRRRISRMSRTSARPSSSTPSST